MTAQTNIFPASVKRALSEEQIPPTWREDDDLTEAAADYQARLDLWRARNGKDGGMEAFRLLVDAARRLTYLEDASQAVTTLKLEEAK